MDDGSAKHDLEQIARTATQSASHTSRHATKLFNKILILSVSFMNKRFNSSMKALQKDGPTKEITQTPPLTHEEMKEIVTKAKEANVLVGIKEMTPEGEIGRRKSLHNQEKIAKHEIKIKKLKNLQSKFSRVKPASAILSAMINRENSAIKSDNTKHLEKRYIILCNKSRVSFLNDCLEEIQKNRTSKMQQNELEDINKDGIIDELDIGELKSRDINLSPDEMDKINEDYGDTLLSEFHHDYSTQKISKEEYCAMRQELFDLYCHAAKTTADDKVLVAIRNQNLAEYMKFAPDKPIKEFGTKGGLSIQSISDLEQLQHLKVANLDEWELVKKKYAGCDYIASHNCDGTVSFLVKQSDTKVLLSEAEKKTTTEKLLDEAEKSFPEKISDSLDDVSKDLENKLSDAMDIAEEK